MSEPDDPLKKPRQQEVLPMPPTHENSSKSFTEEEVSSSTDLEHELLDVWRRVLKLDTISVSDNLFALGGQSLHAMAIVGELKRRLGIDVSIICVFQAPTVADLAEYIRLHGLPASIQPRPDDAGLEYGTIG